MVEPSSNSPMPKGDPLGLSLPPTPERLAWRAEQKQIQQQLAKVFASSPLYRARAKKDPTYLKRFNTGA